MGSDVEKIRSASVCQSVSGRSPGHIRIIRPRRDQDFAPGQNVIDMAGIDADETAPDNQSFCWVGKATLTGAAQLGYYVSGGNTIIRASNDADAAAEVEIQLSGVKALTEGDFRL